MDELHSLPAAPIHVVGESRVREAHYMCSACGRRPVERAGDQCEECMPAEECEP